MNIEPSIEFSETYDPSAIEVRKFLGVFPDESRTQTIYEKYYRVSKNRCYLAKDFVTNCPPLQNKDVVFSPNSNNELIEMRFVPDLDEPTQGDLVAVMRAKIRDLT